MTKTVKLWTTRNKDWDGEKSECCHLWYGPEKPSNCDTRPAFLWDVSDDAKRTRSTGSTPICVAKFRKIFGFVPRVDRPVVVPIVVQVPKPKPRPKRRPQ